MIIVDIYESSVILYYRYSFNGPILRYYYLSINMAEE
jgi:hypothetical protein